MAVERIDKTDRLDYWKVQASSETHKDKEQGQQETGKDAFASLSEKTDWKLFFGKNQLWKKNIQVQKEEIENIIFKKINLKTDPSLLRIDVELTGGEKISPAFLAVPRALGLQLKNLKPGDLIQEKYLMKDNTLRLTVPTNPKWFTEAEKKQKAIPKAPVDESDEATVKRNKMSRLGNLLALRDPQTHQIRLETVLVYGIAGLLLILFIGGFFILR